ncbi:MAG: type II secretion system F family protein, partial [Minisyncoccota bacterium]
NSNYFPSLVSQMVAVGESTGQLDALLARVADFYTREAGETIDNLVELIQPALMIVMGIAVGILFAAVLLPMYGLVQAF